MARLVIVSNRVPPPTPRAPAMAGGLAVALKQALARREALWFGWSGTVAAAGAGNGGGALGSGGNGAPAFAQAGGTTYATIDLSEAEHARYYSGFANGTLWPLLHWRVGLSEFHRDDLAGYRAVNARFAETLLPLLRPDDLVWVHDFHLIPLGAALRARGAAQRIGFFLHVPFPPAALFAALPQGADLLRDLGAYDLVGVQTVQDAGHLSDALAAAGVARQAQAFPIGIDADRFASDAARAAVRADARRLADSLGERALILGIDRLDYSKGLPHRLHGFAQLLARFPAHRRRVTLLQVAPPSRDEVAQYRALRREVDELAGRINGQHGEPDWIPIRWITRAVPRARLAGYHRLARVGLVTPLRDGMNLVAKEFVAAQAPADPGVLVLSRFAGAAEQLSGAIQVNPHDPDEIAEGLHAALAMEPAERASRWQADIGAVRAGGAAAWAEAFLAALRAAPRADQEPG